MISIKHLQVRQTLSSTLVKLSNGVMQFKFGRVSQDLIILQLCQFLSWKWSGNRIQPTEKAKNQQMMYLICIWTTTSFIKHLMQQFHTLSAIDCCQYSQHDGHQTCWYLWFQKTLRFSDWELCRTFNANSRTLNTVDLVNLAIHARGYQMVETTSNMYFWTHVDVLIGPRPLSNCWWLHVCYSSWRSWP